MTIHRPLFVLIALLVSLQAEAAAPPPVEAFFANPVLGSPRLSPSGRFLAVRASKPGTREFLAVINLDTDETKVVASYGNVDIAHFQ